MKNDSKPFDPFGVGDKKWRLILGVCFLLLFTIAGYKAVRKAEKGRTAFVRWVKHTDLILDGKTIYNVDPEHKEEGYPSLPMMALILVPFHALGAVAGSAAWAIAKCGIILWIFYVIVNFCRKAGVIWPPWALVLLLILSTRVFHGDITHANNNLIIGGLIATALWFESRGQTFRAGFIIGLAVVLKVTPGLFLIYFLFKRKWIALVGAAVSGFLFTLVVPSLFLGIGFNWELIEMWFRQMILPFLSDNRINRHLTIYYNQSIPGLLHRLLSHQPAIFDGPDGEQIYLNILSLESATVFRLVKLASLSVLGLIIFFSRTPRDKFQNLGLIGEYALIFLGMLFLSERSWKHHYVLLILPHAFILSYLISTHYRDWRRKVPLTLLGIAAVLQLALGEALVGAHNSDILEGYGVYIGGGFCLFAATAFILSRLRRDGWELDPAIASIKSGNEAETDSDEPVQ